MEAQLQLLIFSLDEQRLALRLEQVERVIRAVEITDLPHAPALVLGLIDLHGDILPVMNMRARLKLNAKALSTDDQFIIARTSRRKLALVVDRVHQIAQRPSGDIVSAGSVVPDLEAIQGLIQLDDSIALIHDLDRFLSFDEDRALDSALSEHLNHAR